MYGLRPSVVPMSSRRTSGSANQKEAAAGPSRTAQTFRLKRRGSLRSCLTEAVGGNSTVETQNSTKRSASSAAAIGYTGSALAQRASMRNEARQASRHRASENAALVRKINQLREEEEKQRSEASLLLWRKMKKLFKRFQLAWKIIKAFGVTNGLTEPKSIGEFFVDYGRVNSRKLSTEGEADSGQGGVGASGAASVASPTTLFRNTQPRWTPHQRYGCDGDGADPHSSLGGAGASPASGAPSLIPSVQSRVVPVGSNTVSDELLQLCALPPSRRTSHGTRRLALFLQSLPYFALLEKETVSDVAKVVHHRCAAENQVLFQQGDRRPMPTRT